MSAIFISHSSADNAAAAEMKAWLEAQGHTSLFLDFDPEAGIKGGSSWEQTLYQQLRQCQAVIALLTPNWLASKWCFAELVQARERGKAIFPVKVQPCEAGGVFSDIQHIDLMALPEEGYRRLRIGLLERGLDPLDVFDWDPKRPPYPGLLAFQEADAAIFFGRGEEIVKTLETLDALRRQGREAAHFVLMLGASGSGKSSLVRAGVIPRLKKKPAEWLPVPPFRPQQEPLDELAVALAAAFETFGRPRDWSAIRTELHTAAAQNPVDGQALLKLTRDLAIVVKQPEATVLLTIDQAEELFGYSPPEAATRFLRLLRAALEAADRQLMAVATLRSDFLGEFQNHPVLQDSDYPHHFRYRAVPVDPMPLRNFAAIIQGPARLAGVQLDEGLVETIVQDTGTRDALPLLAFTLRRLYERYGGDGRLSMDEYESLGRLDGGIRDEAQRVIAEANPSAEELEALHAAFVPTMVRISAEGGYARRRALFDDLPHRALPLLRRFVDARLLVTDRDPQGRETIEVAHEALLRTWPLLSGWLAEDQDKLRLLESIQRSAEEWDQGGRRDDLLVHRNGRLKDAEALLANPRFTLPEASVERAYLDTCSAAQRARDSAEKEEQERRIRDAERIAAEQQKALVAQRRTMRVTLVGLAVAAVIAAVALGLYARAERETRRANANRLAVSSELEKDLSLDLGLLLGAEAVAASAEPTEEAKSALLHSLIKFPDLRALLQGHTSLVSAIAYSPDGTRLATASADRTVRLWDSQTGRPAGPPLTGHTDQVTSVAFSRDGTLLATGSYDHTVRLWNARTGQPIPQSLTGHLDTVSAVAFSPDLKYVASSSWDSMVRIWDLTTGQLHRQLEGHKGGVNGVAFSPDGTLIASAGSDNTVRLWEVSTGQQRPYDLRHECTISLEGCPGAVYVVVFSPDGKYVVSGGYDKAVRWWDVATGVPVGAPGARHANAVHSLSFRRDGSLLISAGSDAMVSSESPLWWAAPTGAPSKPLDGQLQPAALVAFSPDGEHLASADGANVRLWTLDDRERTLERRIFGHDDNVTDIAFSPDGMRFASASEDDTVRVWGADTGTLVGQPLIGHVEDVLRVAFTSDGTRLVSFAADGSVRTWTLENGKSLATVSTGFADVSSVVFSYDGRRLAVGGKDGALNLWDVESSRLTWQPVKDHEGVVSSVAFSPDGERVASVGLDNVLGIWNASTRASIHRIATGHANGVHAVAFDPEGRLLATAGEDGSVRLWDVATATARGAPLMGHSNAALSLAFSADGNYLASGSRDNTVRLWDLRTGQTVGVILADHAMGIEHVVFSPDGKRLVAAGHSRSFFLWDVDVASWVRRACGIANRNLTVAEWRKYMGDAPYRKTCSDLPAPTE